MKNAFIISLTLFTISLNLKSQQLVPNGNFENWVDSVTAASWTSTVSAGIYSLHFMKQTTDSYEGSYAAIIESQSIPMYGAISGIATLGQLIPDLINLKLQPIGGIPCSNKPSKLKGYFKYNPVSTDTMAVLVYVTAYNFIAQKKDTIGYGIFYSYNNTSTYTPFFVNINYNNPNATPDTINIAIYSSYNQFPNANSKLWIDKLEFEYGGIGIKEEQNNNSYINVYPSPTASEINLVLKECIKIKRIYITNQQGQIFYAPYKPIENNTFKINITALKNGIYYLNAESENKIFSKSFSIIK
ncbi:MAG TPA: T9SS type A sorting domain-containing protein [Bacteroidales bacterium]|nr:T9SS type A sorting domain-containing protein [Bacteroidales bacterium]